MLSLKKMESFIPLFAWNSTPLLKVRFLFFSFRKRKSLKANLQEAIELYLEEVHESGLEEEFIPRPAPMEYWVRYFEAEAKEIGTRIKNHEMPSIEINGVVYG